MKFIIISLLLLSFSSYSSYLGPDLSCKNTKQELELTVYDSSFAKELAIKYKNKNCSYSIESFEYSKRSKTNSLTLRLTNKSCKKIFMKKGILKIDITNDTGYAHIIKGKDPVECNVKVIKLKKLNK
jgi:hypothetical protein